MPIPYNKPPASFADQAQLLIDRGMVGDKNVMESKLSSVNYYRLSAYWYEDRQVDPNGTRLETFNPNTCFELVWNKYTFDRRLRLCVIDAIERIEVDFKTNFVNVLTTETGDACAHLNPANFPNFPIIKTDKNTGKRYQKNFPDVITKIKKDIDHSCEEFVRLHIQKYSGDMPFWKTCEVIPFGTASILFEGLNNYTKRKIANRYGLSAIVFEKAIAHLCYLRNLCAHHSRVWNRTMAIKFEIPKAKNVPAFHSPHTISNVKFFGSISLLKYFMDIIAPQSKWLENFLKLMDENPNIPLNSMHFPPNWKEYGIWKS